MKEWTILGNCLKGGEKLQTVLRVPMDGIENAAKVEGFDHDGSYEIPATLICGAGEGKTVLVSASIHNGEYNGVPAVIRAAKAIDPAKLSGNIIFMHCVNYSGFRTHCYRLVAEDGYNLNAGYPGDENGTAGQRIQAWFVKEIFPNVDFVFDLHGGGAEEMMTPLIFWPHHEPVREEALAAAKATNVGFLIESHAETGEYSYFVHNFDKPAMLLERGCGVFCTEAEVKADYDDIRLLLDHFGMYPAEDVVYDTALKRRVFHKTIYLEAEREGLWYPAVSCGSVVKKGESLGRLEDIFGNFIREYPAEDDCYVLYYTQALALKPGDAMVAYGLLSSED